MTMIKSKVIMMAVAMVLAAAAPVIASTDTCQASPDAQASAVKSLESEWGIQVEYLHLSANGYMIDFRYKVIDPAKAAALSSREHKPYLIDEASGVKFLVPNTPKVGPLRQMAKQPATGRIYWMLFSNPGKFVKAGNTVTIVIGDVRIEHIKIQG